MGRTGICSFPEVFDFGKQQHVDLVDDIADMLPQKVGNARFDRWQRKNFEHGHTEREWHSELTLEGFQSQHQSSTSPTSADHA
jgi:hypothetical protein